MGQLAMILAGYNQIDHIWSGWHGICIDGTLEDFSGLQDPAFLTNLVLQAAGGGAFGDAVAAGSKAYAYASCAVALVGDAAAIMEEYEGDDVPCDPVDEFCDEEDGEGGETTLSVTRETLDRLIKEDPSIVEYIEEKSEVDGIVIIVFKQPEGGTNVDAAAAQEAAKKLKEKILAIKSAIAAAEAAVCFYNADGANGGGGSNSSSSANGTAGAIEGLVGTVISAYCLPCGMAFSVVMELAHSFKSVDTCSDKGDAEERGDRHLATLTHKAEDMCHFIRKEKHEKIFTKYSEYFYCCYDGVFSRVLMEQLKAQKGKDWQSCADVTMQEILSMNMSPCSKSTISNGIDGVTIPWNASYSERTQAFQFKENCIDFSDFEEHIAEKVGANIDQTGLYETLDELKEGLE